MITKIHIMRLIFWAGIAFGKYKNKKILKLLFIILY